MDWFRWHHGTVNDPKLRLIAQRCDVTVAEVIAVWAAILENASQAPQRGILDGWDSEVVSIALGIESPKIDEIAGCMRARGMLSDDGEITAWEKRQPKREDSSTERVRRYRERRNAVKRDVTQRNAPEERRGDKSNTPPLNPPQGGSRFAEFWAVYPKKADKRKAQAKWKAKRLDEKAEQIIADVQRRAREHRPWLEGFVPHPTTYLNGDRWEDEIEPVGSNGVQGREESHEGNGRDRRQSAADRTVEASKRYLKQQGLV